MLRRPSDLDSGMSVTIRLAPTTSQPSPYGVQHRGTEINGGHREERVRRVAKRRARATRRAKMNARHHVGLIFACRLGRATVACSAGRPSNRCCHTVFSVRPPCLRSSLLHFLRVLRLFPLPQGRGCVARFETRTTSVVTLPRAMARRFPSRDQAKPKIRSLVKLVSGFGSAPSIG